MAFNAPPRVPLPLIALLFLQTISLAQAAVLRVSQSDPTCGGASPCYDSIQAAVQAAGGGDTVEIEPGVYREKINIASKNKSHGASESDRILITAIEPDSVTVVEPGGTSTPDGKNPKATDREARGLIMIHHSRYVTIRGLAITGSKAAGIQLRGGESGNSGIHLERNRLFGNGSRFGEGGIIVEAGNPGTVIINNLIYANHGDGVRFEPPAGKGSPKGDDDASGAFVIQNTIHGNGWNGVSVAGSEPVMLVNNAITANGTATASDGGRFGVLLGPDAPELSLYNNLICGNRLGETSGDVFAGQHSDNRTPLGTEAVGVIATPECATPDGVYKSMSGPDGKTGTQDDDFALFAAGAQMPSPAIDRGADPMALGLDLHFDPELYEADYTAPDVRPVDKDIRRPLDYDVGALELPCECTNVCFSRCRIDVDPGTGSSVETCVHSAFWNPETQCCDSTAGGEVSERHENMALEQCPETRVPNPDFIWCDDTDGCSGVGLNPDNPTDPAEVCGSHFRFGTDVPKEDLPCNNHDCCYERCGRSQESCDADFYQDMLAVCSQPVSGACALLVDDCLEWAATYRDAVIALGDSSWEGGQNRSCQCCQNK